MVSGQCASLEASVPQVVEDVAEVSPVAVHEVAAVLLPLHTVAPTEHGRQHRLGVSGEGQGRGRVHVSTDVQFDPRLVDLVDL